jgi:hypothetical protein
MEKSKETEAKMEDKEDEGRKVEQGEGQREWRR